VRQKNCLNDEMRSNVKLFVVQSNKKVKTRLHIFLPRVLVSKTLLTRCFNFTSSTLRFNLADAFADVILTFKWIEKYMEVPNFLVCTPNLEPSGSHKNQCVFFVSEPFLNAEVIMAGWQGRH
jgi:hypothetical protein